MFSHLFEDHILDDEDRRKLWGSRHQHAVLLMGTLVRAPDFGLPDSAALVLVCLQGIWASVCQSEAQTRRRDGQSEGRAGRKGEKWGSSMRATSIEKREKGGHSMREQENKRKTSQREAKGEEWRESIENRGRLSMSDKRETKSLWV